MKRPNLLRIKKNFHIQIDQNILLLRKALQLYSSSNIDKNDLGKITELSFLKLILNWEKFIEDTFIGYMMTPKIGTKFKSYIFARDTSHALEILKEGKAFPEWTKRDVILRKSNLYFKNGEPFESCLNMVKSDLDDILKIRNSIVHISKNATEKFQQIVRSKLGHVPKNISPGNFLLLNKSTNPLTTFFEHYKEVLKISSQSLIPK